MVTSLGEASERDAKLDSTLNGTMLCAIMSQLVCFACEESEIVALGDTIWMRTEPSGRTVTIRIHDEDVDLANSYQVVASFVDRERSISDSRHEPAL